MNFTVISEKCTNKETKQSYKKVFHHNESNNKHGVSVNGRDQYTEREIHTQQMETQEEDIEKKKSPLI